MKQESHNFFYVDPDDVHREYFILRGDELQHAVKSLRLSKGAVITAVDGLGNEYTGELGELTRGMESKCQIIKIKRKPNEPLINVTLIHSLLKGGRFDFIVEKAVELGVNAIIPLHTMRSIVSAETQKVHRWRRIAVSAMKQSQRSILPEVTDVMEFEEMLKYTSSGSKIKFILNKDSKKSLFQEILKLNATQLQGSICIATGPEGDFTKEEAETALENSFIPVTLGPRRLRSETAGIAAIAVIMAHDV